MLSDELDNNNPGYHPLIIKKYWQVAKLNYDTSQEPENISELEVHDHTDETFTLLKGQAFLVTSDGEFNNFDMEWLRPEKTYAVPAGVWHNIAMLEGSSVLITENAGTHREKKTLLPLSKGYCEKIIQFLHRKGNVK